jgi:hypothetical protein
MRNMLFGLAAVIGLSGGLQAQTVNDCEWQSSAWNLVEPWEENSRTFSNGQTRLAMMDTIEPAAGAFHLLVISPPYGPLGDRQCKMVSWSQGTGFAGMSFERLNANYDPARGLLFDLPVQIYDPETSFSNSAIMHLVLNQATGDISISMELGGE